jgi:putative NADPH-quinone reductase
MKIEVNNAGKTCTDSANKAESCPNGDAKGIMKILVVNGHPDAESFVAAIFTEFVKSIDRSNHEVEVIELGKMKFDPVLRFGYRKKMSADSEIEKSQELLKWADHVVFIYPIWWSSMPSLLKGWLDRVLTPGFAYSMGGIRSIKHLNGRTAELVLTCDGPAFYYKYLAHTPIKLMKKHILARCGVKVKKVHIFGGVRSASGATRAKFLNRIAERATRL